MKLKNIQNKIQNLEKNGILEKNMKGIEEIRKENKKNEDETLLYGKFLSNFAKIESLLNNITKIGKSSIINKFSIKEAYRQILIRYRQEDLEKLFPN